MRARNTLPGTRLLVPVTIITAEMPKMKTTHRQAKKASEEEEEEEKEQIIETIHRDMRVYFRRSGTPQRLLRTWSGGG